MPMMGLMPSSLATPTPPSEPARKYIETFGKENFFLELQQNLVMGDVQRNRHMAAIARELGIGIVGFVLFFR